MAKGGEKLEKYLADISAKMQGSVNVGFMSNATYPDGTYVAEVAFYNEFGTSKIPSRPFFRNMIAQQSPGWAMRMAKAAKYYSYDGHSILSAMGESISEELKQSIIDFDTPSNAPYTIQKKGFDKPLIDTGHMKDSVSYEVKGKE